MPTYSAKLVSDLIEQFRGGGLDLILREKAEESDLPMTGQRPITYGLMEALGAQLDDVAKFYDDLKNLRTDREAAEGKQLDGIGELVCLSRKEAAALEHVESLTDERYRDYLLYKIWKNTNHCTMDDVLRSIRMFYDGKIGLTEELDYPATIIVETDAQVGEDRPFEEVKEQIDKLLETPIVRAAGVGSLVRLVKNDSPELDIYMGFGIIESRDVVIKCARPQ